MLVFSKARLVILSVPKTGSTAYENALAPMASIAVTSPPDLKHAPLFRYNRFFRPMLEKFVHEKMDILAVMREPVSWLGSWYRYRQRPEMQGQPNATFGMSFDSFVDAYTARQQPCFARVGSQARFLMPARNGTSVTHLFRYEDQAGLVRFLESRLNTELRTERTNVSPGDTPHLSPIVHARLQKVARDDFLLWNGIETGGHYTPLLASV